MIGAPLLALPASAATPVTADSSSVSKTPPGDLAAVRQQRAAAAAPQVQSRAAAAAVASPAVVTLGFDDQRVSQANATSVLASHGMRATYYVISQFINNVPGQPANQHTESLSMAQLKALEAAGHEIAGHTRTHADMATLTTAQQTAEMCGGRTDLINFGFKAPVSFAYPYGSFNLSAENVAKSCPFNNARTVADGPEAIPPAVPMATAAMPSIQDVANSTDPATSVATMESWVTGAESGSNKWVQLVWHDIFPTKPPAGSDVYYQTTPEFTQFLDWLKGEVDAGRAVVKTAAEVMGGTPPPPPPPPPAYQPYGAIGAKWNALGGAAGFLGAPKNNEYAVAGVSGARVEDFVGGTIYWAPNVGAFEVHGAILTHYQAINGPVRFGMPITDESPATGGRYSGFQRATFEWSSATGAFEVHGAIRDQWNALNAERGLLGFPITDELVTPGGGGAYNHFQSSGGSIYWSPATGAHEVYGAIRAAWASQGWEQSVFGFPTTGEFAIPGGRQSNFQAGHYITWTPTGGAVLH